MAKQKRSGRITLRTTPDVHQQLADVARDLGLDVNGLLNLMIRRTLGEMAAEACVFKLHWEEAMKGGRLIPLLRAWEKAHPNRKRRDFLDEFRKHVMGDPSWLDNVQTS
jgi:hypothetical protein